MPDAPPPPPPGATPVPPDEAPPPPRPRPNYLVRRAVAVGAVVIVVAAVAVVIGWVVGRDGGGDDPVGVDTSWDVLAVVDPVTGVVAVTDPESGEVTAEIETEVGRVTETALIGATLVVVGTRGQAGVDVSARTAVDLDPNDTFSGSVSLVRPEGTADTIMLTDDGGNVIIVHGDPVQVIATSTLIELAGVRIDAGSALATADGMSVLLPDVGNFQSVLVTFGEEEPVYLRAHRWRSTTRPSPRSSTSARRPGSRSPPTRGRRSPRSPPIRSPGHCSATESCSPSRPMAPWRGSSTARAPGRARSRGRRSPVARG